jgi:hypothetical protein
MRENRIRRGCDSMGDWALECLDGTL